MLLIKIGGGENINWEYICEDIALLIQGGEKIIVVHGANAVRDDIAERLRIPTKTITSPSGIASVYTDKKAIEVLLMAYCGLVNKEIVRTMQEHAINAIGLSGIDGKLWQAKRKNAIYAVENGKTKLIRNSFVGKVEKINAPLLQLLIQNQYVPVLTTPAISYENEIVNVDNDFAVAVMVQALEIKKVISLFGESGLLRDMNNKKSVIAKIKKQELEEYLTYTKGRMKKKLLGAKKAFENGLEAMYWGDGRIKHPIKNALEGKGTIIQ